MARVTTKQPKPIEIEQWLGINESVGETQIKLGEWVKGFNFRVTKNMKPQKRPGHYTFVDVGTGDIQGIWSGVISGKKVILFCHDGNVYSYDMTVVTETILLAGLITEGVVTLIGSITDARTTIFWFSGKIYFMNGIDYKAYDGTTYQDVVPYVPTVSLNAPPTGGGTLFEEINLLTGKKKQTFVGDGSATLYQLVEVGLDSDLLVITVDGVNKIENTDFTVNRTLGQVTFTSAPANLSEVVIEWTKVIAGNADLIKNHKYSYKYGVDNSLNLFIYGNPNEKNVYRYSGIKKAGYFPANSFVEAGSDEFAITSLQNQYKQLVVFKENEAKLVNPTINPNFTDNTGLNPYNFGYEDLNDAVGNIAPDMVQLIENQPMTLSGYSMYAWASATSVENERNANVVSDRLKLSLQGLDLSNASTFDYENQKEYWVNVDDIVYIWNYGNNTMYKYNNISAIDFIDVDGDIYYSSNGSIERFNESYLCDGELLGDNIPCKIYGGFSDLGLVNNTKLTREQWLSIASASRTSCKLAFLTENQNQENASTESVQYVIFDYGDIDYGDWSYDTNLNVQPNWLEIRVFDFTYIQWILENDTNNESLTVLGLALNAQTVGKSKRR